MQVFTDHKGQPVQPGDLMRNVHVRRLVGRINKLTEDLVTVVIDGREFAVCLPYWEKIEDGD